MFTPYKQANHIISWIQDWFRPHGNDACAVIGISGGKDSTIVAALLSMAIGPDRVIGVLMPDAVQDDLDDAKRVVEALGINGFLINIAAVTAAARACRQNAIPLNHYAEKIQIKETETARINLPPRIRMSMLYLQAQSLATKAFVVNTCNLSEEYIGNSTKYGDATGDFAPLREYTVTEVCAIGHAIRAAIGLPADLIDKVPADGLCGLSDEQHFGFPYSVLDKYIRHEEQPCPALKKKIDNLHAASRHKLIPIPSCPRLLEVS